MVLKSAPLYGPDATNVMIACRLCVCIAPATAVQHLTSVSILRFGVSRSPRIHFRSSGIVGLSTRLFAAAYKFTLGYVETCVASGLRCS